MFGQSKIIIISIVSMFIGLSAFANCETSAIARAGLSKKQVLALVDIFEGDYELRIYSKKVNASKQYLLAIGETHVKDEKSALATAGIQREFSAFALESSDPAKYSPFSFLSSFEIFYTRSENEVYNSSIDIYSLKDEMIASIEEGLISTKELREKSEKNIKKLSAHFQQPEELVREVYWQVLDSFKRGEPEALKTQIFYVEKNHRPNLMEKLSFNGFLVAAHFSNYKGLKTLLGINLIVRLFLETPILYSGVHLHEYLSLLIVPISLVSVEKLFLGFAKSPNRDKAMVDGLDSSLEEANSKYLIYFVGVNHLPIQEPLLRERGYEIETELLYEIEELAFEEASLP
ncbi:MAG: hypothetical protein VX642_03920 [Bdellovibrionota bacterium]|nr:hypothetical protein [Bdellovibrionota bacterium]